MALNPPPIQEITTAQNGRFPQVWIRWFQNLSTLINNIDKILAGLANTGLINPVTDGLISINAGDNSTFDLTAGVARFVDSYTDQNNPTMMDVSFGPFTGVSVDNIATDSATFIYIDTNGDIVQETELQDGGYLRDHVGVGILTHPDNATIAGVSGFTPTTLSNTTMSFADQSFCMGAVNCPDDDFNIVSGNSGTLGLDKTRGKWYFHAINTRTSQKDPNVIESAALTKPVMFIGWTVTDNPEGKLIAQDTIPAGVYDDGTADTADALPQGTVATNEWVNHRVFHVTDSNQIAVQIGVMPYASLAAAKIGIASEDFVTIPVLQGTTPICTVSMRGGATDLSISTDAEIRQAIPPRATFQ